MLYQSSGRLAVPRLYRSEPNGLRVYDSSCCRFRTTGSTLGLLSEIRVHSRVCTVGILYFINAWKVGGAKRPGPEITLGLS